MPDKKNLNISFFSKGFRPMFFTSIEIAQHLKMKCRLIYGRNSIRWIAMALSIVFVITVFSTFTASNNLIGSECNLGKINSANTAQDDPCLLHIIRTRFLHPPSSMPLNLTHPEVENPSFGMSQKVNEILKYQRGGFFVEGGALDGESYSNSIYMERNLNWEGLLIEPNPISFNILTQKHRKAWTICAAMSIVPYPKVVTFDPSWLPDLGSIVTNEEEKKSGLITVQTFPIYSILLALNRTTVDFFSLDVEGLELEVLRTIPWSKANIRTLAVEFFHIKEGKEVLDKYMDEQGYRNEGKIIIDASTMPYDVIYSKL